MQFDHDVDLHDKSPILAIFPETYLGDSAYVTKIKALGAEVLTYPVYPLRSQPQLHTAWDSCGAYVKCPIDTTYRAFPLFAVCHASAYLDPHLLVCDRPAG